MKSAFLSNSAKAIRLRAAAMVTRTTLLCQLQVFSRAAVPQ